MRTIIHISDLHFGRHDGALVESLLSLIAERAPDLVVVSGDFTQRAKKREFRQAREFLARIPCKVLAVPGNHDIPLYRFWERFTMPYRNYRRSIGEDLEPTYVDKEIAVIGMNSVRVFKAKEGRVNSSQVDAVVALTRPLPDEVMTFVVTHHPFNVLNTSNGKPLARARGSLGRLQAAGIDVLLSGHLHLSSPLEGVYKIPDQRALVVHAGTATSTRTRGEVNSFNIITVDAGRVSVERYARHETTSTFVLAKTEQFAKAGSVWKPN